MVSEEVKTLVTYMRSQGVSSFRLADLEVTFAAGAAAPAQQTRSTEASVPEQLVTEEQRKKEEEALLFHSSG